MTNNIKNYVCVLSAEQIVLLHSLLSALSWEFSTLPYAHWRARSDKVNVTAYESGKLTVQGAGTADFVLYTLEPQVLKKASFGYEEELAAEQDPKMFEPHAGIDESGKGDYFGPLTIACCYTDSESAKKLLKAGIVDSKKINSDKKIIALAKQVKEICEGKFSIVAIGPKRYNEMYESFRNLNRLLAWGHSRALENLLEKVPDCPRAVSDQFAKADNLLAALKSRGRKIVLEQRTKAESDIAVAAASILARAEFVERLEKLSEISGIKLAKGAGKPVQNCVKEIFASKGKEVFPEIGKMHFKTSELIGE